MKQRAVSIVADYLSKRPRGRISRVVQVADGDYLMAVEDLRDGRAHLIHSVGDLDVWIDSFRQGRCLLPTGAICGICDQVHADRDLDGELLSNCIACQAELVDVWFE